LLGTWQSPSHRRGSCLDACADKEKVIKQSHCHPNKHGKNKLIVPFHGELFVREPDGIAVGIWRDFELQIFRRVSDKDKRYHEIPSFKTKI
jgi:hypothetical protein